MRNIFLVLSAMSLVAYGLGCSGGGGSTTEKSKPDDNSGITALPNPNDQGSNDQGSQNEEPQGDSQGSSQGPQSGNTQSGNTQSGNQSSQENKAPVAVAGDPISIVGNTAVTLDGSKSSDPEGKPLAYKWEQVSGDKVVLSNENSSLTTFQAPLKRQDLNFKLTVNDGSLASSPSTTTVSIKNNPPAANAGSDQAKNPGDTVTLDGSQSADPDGDNLNYTWTIISTPQNGTTTLSDIHAVKPSFSIPANLPMTPDKYAIQLEVDDGFGGVSTGQTNVSVGDMPPIITGVEYSNQQFTPNFVLLGQSSLDLKNQEIFKLKANVVDKDTDIGNLVFKWAVVTGNADFILKSGASTSQIEIAAPAPTGSYAQIKFSVSDKYTTVDKIITLKTWKRVSYLADKPPAPLAIFVDSSGAYSCNTRTGASDCPYKTIDDAFKNSDDKDIYFSYYGVTLSSGPDKWNRSLIGGYEVNNNEWLRPGYGYLTNKRLTYILLDSALTDGELLSFNKPGDILEVSGFSVKSECPSKNGSFKTISVNNSAANIMFNQFETTVKGGSWTLCNEIYGNDAEMNINNNDFNHFADADVQVYSTIMLDTSSTAFSKTSVIGNNTMAFAKVGKTITVVGGKVSILSNKIYDVRALLSNFFGNRRTGIYLSNVHEATISGNKMITKEQQKDIQDLFGIEVLPDKIDPGFITISSNLFAIYPNIDNFPVPPIGHQNVLTLNGTNNHMANEMRIFNNTFVTTSTSSIPMDSSVAMACNFTKNMYLSNNIFYLEKPFQGIKYGFSFDKTNCKIKSAKNNVFRSFGTGSIDPIFIRSSDVAITSISDFESGYPTLASGNKEVDPKFVTGDVEYHLASDSPLIDGGYDGPDGAGWADVTTDIDGQIRPYTKGVIIQKYDIGADEYLWAPLFLSLP